MECVSFSSDGRRVVSGSSDKTVQIWNAETQEQVGEALQGHSTDVECVSESADGRHIVSRDEGGNTIIWSRENRGDFCGNRKKIERDSQNDVTDEENGSEKDSTDGVRALKTNGG